MRPVDPRGDCRDLCRGKRLGERRQLIAAGLLLSLSPRLARADEASDALQAAIRDWAGAVTPREGRVLLDIPPLVENGNAVPISVTVDSPMSAADHVRELVVFNERNPQRDVARLQFSAHSGRAMVATRIRLSTSQQLVALARMNDGSIWSHRVEVLVTLAACIES